MQMLFGFQVTGQVTKAYVLRVSTQEQQKDDITLFFRSSQDLLIQIQNELR